MRNLTSKGRTVPPRDSITVHQNVNCDNHLIIPGSFTGEQDFMTLVGVNMGRIWGIHWGPPCIIIARGKCRLSQFHTNGASRHQNSQE